MSKISEILAEHYRTGKPVQPNPANKITSSRRKMYSHIEDLKGGNKEEMYKYSLDILSKYLPNLQRYVLSQNEVPNKDLGKLVKQAYNLRCKQIDNYARATNTNTDTAQILLEEEEAENDEFHSPDKDTYLGGLSAPVGIAASYMQFDNFDDNTETDNFIDPALLTGVFNTLGSKINSADLKRAAQNKPAGIFGALGQGGTSAYNALRSFLQKPENSAAKQAILNGTITDISQIPNFGYTANTGGINVLAQDAIQNVKQQEIKKMLPYIIIGLIVFTLVIVLIVRKHDRK